MAALAGHDRPKGCTTPYCGPPPKLCAVQCVTAPLHDIYVISDLYTLPPRVARRLPDLTIASRNGAICSCLKRGLCGLAIRLGRCSRLVRLQQEPRLVCSRRREVVLRQLEREVRGAVVNVKLGHEVDVHPADP